MRLETSPTFERNLKQLAKRYRHIRDDLQPVLERLAAGEILGDAIPGVALPVFKLRLPNRDAQSGKRGGYRLIHYLKEADRILLVTIYTKTDQADISAEQIRSIIAQTPTLSNPEKS